MPKPGPRTTNKYSDRQQMRWMSRTAEMPSIKLAEPPVVDSAVGANVVPTWRSRNVVWRSDMGRLNVPRLPGLATKRAGKRTNRREAGPGRNLPGGIPRFDVSAPDRGIPARRVPRHGDHRLQPSRRAEERRAGAERLIPAARPHPAHSCGPHRSCTLYRFRGRPRAAAPGRIPDYGNPGHDLSN